MINHKITNDAQGYFLQHGHPVASTVSARVLLGKMRRRLTGYYRRYFHSQNLIFRHEGPFVEDDHPDCEFACYKSVDDLPKQAIADIRAKNEPNSLETDKLELNDNALLWTATVNGRIATTAFTRKGKYFRRWFLELRADDVVVFRLRTHPEFRGRGLAPALIRHAIKSVMEKPGYAYIDCGTHNKPSIRCIEKAGFKYIATRKPIKREWALYD